MKIPDKFKSPQHAIDVIRRLLSTCGMVIDDTMPSVIGYLDKNIRISVDKRPSSMQTWALTPPSVS